MSLHILQLRGELFFGSAVHVLAEVREHLGLEADTPAPPVCTVSSSDHLNLLRYTVYCVNNYLKQHKVITVKTLLMLYQAQ
jgi:hypothetical protein